MELDFLSVGICVWVCPYTQNTKGQIHNTDLWLKLCICTEVKMYIHTFHQILKVCTWSHHEIVFVCMSLISWCLSSDAFAQQCWGTWWHTLWAADSDYWLPVPSQLIPCLSVLQSVCLSVCLEWRPALLHSQPHPHLWLKFSHGSVVCCSVFLSVLK